jgi:hypothetical protein
MLLSRHKSLVVVGVVMLSTGRGNFYFSTSVKRVRVPGCNASAIRVTLPWNVRLGMAGTRTLLLKSKPTIVMFTVGSWRHMDSN